MRRAQPDQACACRPPRAAAHGSRTDQGGKSVSRSSRWTAPTLALLLASVLLATPAFAQSHGGGHGGGHGGHGGDGGEGGHWGEVPRGGRPGRRGFFVPLLAVPRRPLLSPPLTHP